MSAEQCASTSELQEFKKREDGFVIDVRNPHELGENKCDVIEAKTWANIPFPEIDDALELSEAEFKSKYGIDKPKKDSSIVFHCGLGGRSSKALAVALSKGYDKAKHYPGGYKKWKEETK